MTGVCPGGSQGCQVLGAPKEEQQRGQAVEGRPANQRKPDCHAGRLPGERKQHTEGGDDQGPPRERSPQAPTE